MPLAIGVVALAVMVPAQIARADFIDTDFVWLSAVPPPSLSVPATSAYGAVVTYTAPTAIDDAGDEDEATEAATCLPASGATFPLGTTTVNCSAADPDNDSSPLMILHTSFTVTVFAPDSDLDFTPPADITVDATNSSGTVVHFATPIATDGDDESVPAVSCASSGGLASGSVFPIGATTVTCSVTDSDDSPSTVTHSFTITVNDTDLAISPGVSPAPVKAMDPHTGAPVTFTIPTATDEDPGPIPVTCIPASGSWFAPGQTTVTCSASDSDDTPSTVSTTLTVTVYEPATAPDPPIIGTATPGEGVAAVTFAPPPYDGSSPVTGYTVTCTASDGTSSTTPGPYSPIFVTGLKGGKNYSCTARAVNAIGTSDPSGASNTVVPAVVDSCTDTDTCHAASATQSSSTNPPERVDITGTPSDATGTVELTVGSEPLSCPGSPVSSPAAGLTDTGFSASSKLTATLTQFAVATGPGKVCYSSDVPFLSETNPTIPQAGTAILLQCSAVANKAPCQLSSTQTLSAIVVKILVPGGDPTFSVVVPTGRLVWPSTFPNGKVGTAYSAHLLSKGGKAPFHWKINSGKLPPGLTINTATGTVTGKPKSKGTFKCVVHVSDSESPPQSANISVSITIN